MTTKLTQSPTVQPVISGDFRSPAVEPVPSGFDPFTVDEAPVDERQAYINDLHFGDGMGRGWLCLRCKAVHVVGNRFVCTGCLPEVSA